MNKFTKVLMVCLTLLLVVVVQPALGSDWAQFQKDNYNSGVTADRAPITDPMELPLSWEYQFSFSGWSGIDEAPVIAGDMVYAVGADNHIYAFNKTTGTLIWEKSTSGGGFLLGNMAVGNGKVFVPTNNGKVFAFDAETGAPQWNKTVSSKQLDTPIVYSDGKIYFGEAMGGHKYYCLDEASGDEVWNRTATTQVSSQGSYYWAGAAVIGDSLVYGDDDGHLVSVNKDTGDDIAEINVSEEFGVTCKEIRSSVLYVEELKRIYFTSKGGYCYALGFNATDGTFDTSEKYIANIGYSTSTPAYYNGRIYVGASGIYCLEADLSKKIWHYAAGNVQSSPVISTYYDDGDGEVYIYFTVNGNPGGVFCLMDCAGFTTPELVWSYSDASKTAYTLAGAAISDGWIYYGTDKKYLFGLTAPEPEASAAPTANFSADNLSGDAPLTVQFADHSTGERINAWAWDFDNDGTVDSNVQNPQFTYNNAGNYTVNLTVTNAVGSNSTVKTDYITVYENSTPSEPEPVAAFMADVTNGTVPLTVNFTDQSSGSPTSWLWDFGDNSTATEQNPVHIYTATGTYTVNLTVSNADGSDSKVKTGYINVASPSSAKPVAAFSASPTSGKTPLNVKFTDTSTGSPTSWKWEFGDGSKSYLQNPIHKYSKAGIYTVNLTVKNAAGRNTVTKTEYIKVITKPVANFSADPTSGKTPLNVKFTDKSTGSPTSWFWNFGDGSKSFLQNPVHKYSKAGVYTVNLTVKNAIGRNTVTKTEYIKVITKPVANFASSVTSGKTPSKVTFADTSIGSPTSWKWDFGDGSKSFLQNPTHKYSKAGTYTVNLTVKNAKGRNTVTKTDYIKVKTV